MRPVAIAATGSASAFSVDADEFVIDVIFSPLVDQGAGRLAQEGTCAMPSGEAIPCAVSDEHGGHADGVRVFAGPRSDPFFLDMLALRNSRKLRQLAFTDPGTNTIDGLNVLSIVVEANAAQFGGGPLLGVVAETLAAGKLPVRMERFGRPELKNIIMAPKIYDEINRDLEIRDLYNSEDAFDLGPAYLGTYRARLNANLAFYDSLDGTIDWPLGEDGAHPLTEFLLPDFMVVDVTKPFSDEGCFEIERAMLADRPHATCGGRSLQRRRHGFALHADHRQWGDAGPRRRRPGDRARVPNLPIPRAAKSDPARVAVPAGTDCCVCRRDRRWPKFDRSPERSEMAEIAVAAGGEGGARPTAQSRCGISTHKSMVWHGKPGGSLDRRQSGTARRAASPAWAAC